MTSIENSFHITANLDETWTMDSSLVHVMFGSLLTTDLEHDYSSHRFTFVPVMFFF